ncbi:hypothetical protein UY3_07786 [Chelonia mydas]|uniref:Uncharacterized protein n=1 Tax=Chelonia mydas TaxID=8469 RepID=M7BAS4_CHEMY|nr:hypothetical protein UY3_07786 [Chelonia mydas]
MLTSLASTSCLAVELLLMIQSDSEGSDDDIDSMTDSERVSDDKSIDSLHPEFPEGGYTPDAIGRFLGETKGKRGVEVADWLPDFDLTLLSAQYIKRHVSVSEFDKQNSTD